MWVINIGRKIDVRKWCPFTIIGWWRRSNSRNVGPVWEYISISSDSTNNSSDSFRTINFLPLKRYAHSERRSVKPPTIEAMWCEIPKTLIGSGWRDDDHNVFGTFERSGDGLKSVKSILSQNSFALHSTASHISIDTFWSHQKSENRTEVIWDCSEIFAWMSIAFLQKFRGLKTWSTTVLNTFWQSSLKSMPSSSWT
jgi:hypothetical protein